MPVHQQARVQKGLRGLWSDHPFHVDQCSKAPLNSLGSMEGQQQERWAPAICSTCQQYIARVQTCPNKYTTSFGSDAVSKQETSLSFSLHAASKLPSGFAAAGSGSAEQQPQLIIRPPSVADTLHVRCCRLLQGCWQTSMHVAPVSCTTSPQVVQVLHKSVNKGVDAK